MSKKEKAVRLVSSNKQALVTAGCAGAGAGAATLLGLSTLGVVLSTIGGGLLGHILLTGLTEEEEEDGEEQD